jgi:hypothetical protein
LNNNCHLCIKVGYQIIEEARMLMSEQWVNEWAEVRRKKLLEHISCHIREYFHFMHICIFWHCEIFLNKAWNILSHGERSSMKTFTILWVVVFIYSNGAYDLKHWHEGVLVNGNPKSLIGWKIPNKWIWSQMLKKMFTISMNLVIELECNFQL